MMDGPAKALAENKDVKEFYLGLSSEGRKSFRDMKIVPAPQALALSPSSDRPGGSVRAEPVAAPRQSIDACPGDPAVELGHE